MTTMRTTFTVALLALAALVSGCSGELTNSAAPVELVATTEQNLQLLDLVSPSTDPECEEDIGTINLLLVPKREGVTTDASQVRITRYRVSYQRTDGGTTVPASFVRSIDTLVSVGETVGVSEFLVVEPDALTQAPFAALRPQNGGRDPVTGRPFVKMDVIVEFFGETLGGDRVYDATRFPLDFCYDCGGCD
jgi:hypothetical protein